MFYDRESLVRRPDSHIEVWVKELPDFDIDRSENSKSGHKGFIDRVATKILSGYEPPYASVAEVNEGLLYVIVSAEDVANNTDVKPTMRVLLEVDCPGRLCRALSVYLVKGSKRGFSDTPGQWGHVPPETNIAALFKLLCPRP
jgi:hypothetical protein